MKQNFNLIVMFACFLGSAVYFVVEAETHYIKPMPSAQLAQKDGIVQAEMPQVDESIFTVPEQIPFGPLKARERAQAQEKMLSFEVTIKNRMDALIQAIKNDEKIRAESLAIEVNALISQYINLAKGGK